MTAEERQMKNRKRRQELEKKRRTLLIVCGVVVVALLALIGYGIYWLVWQPVQEEVSIEIGEEITLGQFLLEEDAEASFVTDVSEIDTSKLGEHDVIIKVGSRNFTSKMYIIDTVAPTGEAAEVQTKIGTMPQPTECVANIVDKTQVAVSFKEEPDVSAAGDVTAVLLLTDEGGNTAELDVVIHVWEDTQAPVISGVSTIQVVKGGTVSYRKGVTVTDDKDDAPKLTVDNSKVNLNKVGSYQVVYTATDASGNTSSVTGTVKVIEEVKSTVSKERVLKMAQEVLDSITKDSMSDMEVAFAIYRWVTRSIGYTDNSNKTDWVAAAYRAFDSRNGDCYNYFAAAKALYEVAGIENVDVEKSVTTYSRHYWSLINLGSGWYHVDCTPRKGDGDLFFMVTDAELEAYSKKHSNSHIFNSSLYPARATESVQSKVNYKSGKITK